MKRVLLAAAAVLAPVAAAAQVPLLGVGNGGGPVFTPTAVHMDAGTTSVMTPINVPLSVGGTPVPDTTSMVFAVTWRGWPYLTTDSEAEFNASDNTSFMNSTMDERWTTASSTVTGCPGACVLTLGGFATVDPGAVPVTRQELVATGITVGSTCQIGTGSGTANGSTYTLTGSGCVNLAARAINSDTEQDESTPGSVFVWEYPGAYSFRWNITDSTASYSCDITVPDAPDGAWHTYIGGFDGSGTSQTKGLAVYKDGVRIASNCVVNVATGTPMNVGVAERGWEMKSPGNFGDGRGMIDYSLVLQDYATNIVCDTANGYSVTVAGVPYACTNPGDGSSVISPVLLAKLGSVAAPVDYGATGSGPLGRQPEVYYETTTGAAGWVNKGSVTNITSTRVQSVPDGPNSPAPAHRPWLRWADGDSIPNASTSIAMNANNNTINTGDLILYGVLLADNGAGSPAHTFTCAGSDTLQLVNTEVGNSGPVKVAICSRIAGAGETGAINITWTGNSTGYGGQWFEFDLAGAAGVDAINSKVSPTNGAVTTAPTSTALTLPSANDTILVLWNGAGAYSYLTSLPAPIRYSTQGGPVVTTGTYAGAKAPIILTEQFLTNAAGGSFPAQTAGGANDTWNATVIAIKGN